MLVCGGDRLILNRVSSALLKQNAAKYCGPLCKKRDFNEQLKSQEPSILKLRVSNPILVRAAVAVIGLGFVDAGYSGDWSRIGVISKETEDLLKVAAFLAVPLCIFLIFSITKDAEA